MKEDTFLGPIQISLYREDVDIPKRQGRYSMWYIKTLSIALKISVKEEWKFKSELDFEWHLLHSWTIDAYLEEYILTSTMVDSFFTLLFNLSSVCFYLPIKTFFFYKHTVAGDSDYIKDSVGL